MRSSRSSFSAAQKERIVFRGAPSRRYLFSDLRRQVVEKVPVILQVQGFADLAVRRRGVRRAAQQVLDQTGSRLRQIINAVTGLGHGGEQCHGAGRRVETDAVADAPVAVGIVGPDQRHPAVRGGCRLKPRPACCKFTHEPDAVRHDGIGDNAELRILVEARLGLEGDRT